MNKKSFKEKATEFFLLLQLLTLFFFNRPDTGLSKSYDIAKIGNFNSPIRVVSVLDNKIFVGTEKGFYFSSYDKINFVQWTQGLSDVNITGFVKVKARYFLGTREGGIYYSNKIGDKWVSYYDKINCPTVTSLSTDGNNIYLTSICSGFFVSFDGGETWYNRNGNLPTLRSTSFLKAKNGICFLGTDNYGLFYSDDLGETCKWISAFRGYTVNTITYFSNKIYIGTDKGLFVSDENNLDFRKKDVLKQDIFVPFILTIKNNLFVLIRDKGVFVTTDGENYFQVFEDELLSPTVAYIDSSNFLYIGDFFGNVYKVNMNSPILLLPRKIDLGEITEDKEWSIKVLNIGFGKVFGYVDSPTFILVSPKDFEDNEIIKFKLISNYFPNGSFNVPVKLNYDGMSKYIYITFLKNYGQKLIKLKINSSEAFVNGKKHILDGVPFINKNTGRALVPIRFVSEALGAKVNWEESSKTISIVCCDKIVELKIGSSDALIGEQKIKIDQPPVIIKDRTFVPIRFISEAFGAKVEWEEKTKTITITYKP